MKVGLIDIGGKIPNLALMKIASYHKSRGNMVTLGTGGNLTYISCIFSKHRHIAEKLLEIYPNAVVGGTGWDHGIKLPPEIESCSPDYSLYGIDYGLGRLTAGCPRGCPWCVVPACEGKLSRTVSEAGNLVNPKSDFLVLLDANILACPDWLDHFHEIRDRGLTVHFTQGLDIRLVNDRVATELARLKISNLHRTDKQIYFAWDRIDIEPQVIAGIKALSKAGFKLYNLRFYVLVGFNTTWEQDWYRFKVLQELGCKPFIMCYEGSGPKLKAFANWVNRFYYKSCSFEKFKDSRWNPTQELQQSFGF